MKYLLSILSSAILLSASAGATAEVLQFERIGEFRLPTGLKLQGVEFGGISGLDYEPIEDVYYALSDDRAEYGPARFYKLKLAIDAKGVHGLDIVETVPLLNADGKVFDIKDVDPESIRYNAASKTLIWASEGDRNGRPAIREARLDGHFVREFVLPEAFYPDSGKTKGVRSNLSFESLAISGDGRTLFAGTENALTQDGDKASLEQGSRSRIVAFDLASGEVTAQYAYDGEPIFTRATVPPFWNDNGLSEFTFYDGRLLTVERSFAQGVGTRINLFLADPAAASNVDGMETLKNEQFLAMPKQEVLRLDEGSFGLDIDNIEALTFGPLIDGKNTLILASDNNFNPQQFTQFVVLRLK